MVDKYSWVDVGSSYLMNDVSAAYLWGQLEKVTEINADRLQTWTLYRDGLKELEKKGLLTLPSIPEDCTHNAHMFYIKLSGIDKRAALIRLLNESNILAVFHYIPLHSSTAGLRFGEFNGDDENTTIESERLLRLPMYYGISNDEVKRITEVIVGFYG